MTARNILRHAIAALLGSFGLMSLRSPAHAAYAYSSVTIEVMNFPNPAVGQSLSAYVSDSNFLSEKLYATATGNGTFSSQDLLSDANYFYWYFATNFAGQPTGTFTLAQTAIDLGFYFPDPGSQSYTETKYIANPGGSMTLSFDFATYVLSANLFTYSGSVPAPVPLPPSLPVLASGLLALASVRFASRDARR